MTRELVLVHGRSQQRKNPDDLKATWIEALERGLAKNGLSLPIPESDVHFPYYGDALVNLIDGHPPGEIIVKGDDDAGEEEFVADVVDEMRKQQGVTEQEIAAEAQAEVVEQGVQNWAWVRAALSILDRKLPGTSGLSISLATHDVYEYLVTQSIRYDIDERVRAAFTPGAETVVVSHSLGTVVAANVLRTIGADEGWSVPQLVTVGSPLGITRIKREFPSPRWPSCVGEWFNALDERDVVALFPLTPEHFGVGDGHQIDNKTDVNNHTPNRHGIAGYLDDATTAKLIYDALIK